MLGLIGGRCCVVDGEICVLNASVAGDAEFRRLMTRAARRGYRPGDDMVDFVVFDVLIANGRSVMHRPLATRRELLLELLDDRRPHVRVIDQTRERGKDMYQAAVGLGLEGIVAKRLDLPYQPGVRSSGLGEDQGVRP